MPTEIIQVVVMMQLKKHITKDKKNKGTGSLRKS